MKIKVTKEVKELEGNVEEKVATPFGNSAHINVGKKHTGKVLMIVEPIVPEYEWVFSTDELRKTIDACHNVLDSEDNKATQLKRNLVNALKDKRFARESLYVVKELLSKSKGSKALLKSIKTTYNL